MILVFRVEYLEFKKNVFDIIPDQILQHQDPVTKNKIGTSLLTKQYIYIYIYMYQHNHHQHHESTLSSPNSLLSLYLSNAIHLYHPLFLVVLWNIASKICSR